MSARRTTDLEEHAVYASNLATDKQINFIINLWNEANDGSASFLSQTDLPLTQRERRGGMTGAEASRYIGQLKKQVGRR